MLTLKLWDYEANEDAEPLKFEDPFELALKAKWAKRGVIVGVEHGVTKAVSDGFDLFIRWHKDPGVDVWDEQEYDRIISWRRLAEDEISGRVNRRLMFAMLFTFDWYPQKGDKWLGILDVLAREAK
jgi:hypothetical protein